MKKGCTDVCTEIEYGSDEYNQTLALRDEILRKPLGLEFTPQELAMEQNAFHLACWQDDTLAGCLVLMPLSGKQIRMRQLAVRSDMQKQGIGRRLVAYAEAFTRDRGYEDMVLHARETAVEFYRQAGYDVEGDRFIEATIPHFYMRKNLLSSGEQAPEPCA